jgi:hypothetical protein
LNTLSRKPRESGLSVVLAFQVVMMFVLAPLASTGVLPSLVVDICRMALAAAAVILLSYSRWVSVAITATLVVSIANRQPAFGLCGDHRRAAALCRADGVRCGHRLGRRQPGVRRRQSQRPSHHGRGHSLFIYSLGVCQRLPHLRPAAARRVLGIGHGEGHFAGNTLYFSLSTLTTLTTTGFGDIAPLHPLVRSIANLESVIGQLFPATLLARLVTLHAATDVASSETAAGK